MSRAGTPGDETILAVSSPPGIGARAILRLSGPDAYRALASVAGRGGQEILSAPGGSCFPVELGAGGVPVAAWVHAWRCPRSYTAEDLLEVLLPGSQPLLSLVARALLERAGLDGLSLRWARAGEFTLRAYLHGRIDLSQAEAVASLIAATGEAEALAARRSLRGELGDRARQIAGEILEIVASLEAGLDFPDEELPEVTTESVRPRIAAAAGSLGRLHGSTALRVPTGDALQVVLAGLPNAGKSSLLNALLGRPAAITSDVPGTTRDPVRGATLHCGRRVEWIDIAGFSSFESLASGDGDPDGTRPGPRHPQGTGSSAVLEIVRRLSRVEIEHADIVLWVVDPRGPAERSLEGFARLAAPSKILVFQKADLLSPLEEERLRQSSLTPLVVSARTRKGLDGLVARVLGLPPPGGGPAGAPRSSGPVAAPRYLVSSHQESAISVAEDRLRDALGALDGGLGHEYVVADLRDALGALDDLSGRVPRDAVLDWVFSRFCIGK